MRAANVYFLCISVLTSMEFSPKAPESMIGTFAIVLIFTSLKEAYEDSQRAFADREMNRRKTTVLNRKTNEFTEVQWADIKVGDIVRVDKD